MSSRGIIIGIKTVLFIGLSAVTVATAYGYRLDTQEGTLARTGILDVAFVPEDARLFIDGDEADVSRGKAIVSLPLGRHHITIAGDGFHPFHKTVHVEADLAIRLGTIYLVPLPTHSLIGQTDAVQEFAGQTSEVVTECADETAKEVASGKAVFEDGAFYLNGVMIAADVGTVSGNRDGAVFTSEFSLQELNDTTGSIRTVHRFTKPIRRMSAGPDANHVFVATETDVSLCNIAQAVCAHTLHSPDGILSMAYDTDATVFNVVAERNQRMTVDLSSWKRSLFGL